ncbi:hypothetical protein SCALIN_C13_0194 [Candidatus Scalindua japonica]|uniref:DUF104 domain-containing protein n=1 Tax=Candidatus Scalindua japonica TaxID=1284222 RepID=A0A286TXQ0_9BACT|nr:antitoxin family protein [Candidatus Scalindua japonica]GAX60679.1 hypothetical protein SCALIN_C13_0194 [Candidatus Scalindua japonica]
MNHGKHEYKKTIRVKFSKGVFHPLEKINIPEGKEVVIAIPDEPKKKCFADALDETYGSWKDTIDCDKFIKDIYVKDIYADRHISTRPEVKL